MRDQVGFSFGDPFLPDEFCDSVREVVQDLLGDFVHGAAPVCRGGAPDTMSALGKEDDKEKPRGAKGGILCLMIMPPAFPCFLIDRPEVIGGYYENGCVCLCLKENHIVFWFMIIIEQGSVPKRW